MHTASEDSLTLTGLDEGVGTIRFVYTSVTGTHSVVGSRMVGSTATDTVLTAARIPAQITLEQALATLYAGDEHSSASFVCTITP